MGNVSHRRGCAVRHFAEERRAGSIDGVTFQMEMMIALTEATKHIAVQGIVHRICTRAM